MKFSAAKFCKDKRYRHLLPESHLSILDGLTVTDGQIDYEVDGEEFYLYPILREWCEEEQS